MTGQMFQDIGLQAKNGESCACCSTEAHGETVSAEASSQITPESAVTADYLVEGMTCAHCVSSVTEELSALDGVVAVNVDLNAGGLSAVHVSSTADIKEELVREAVEEAGYRLAARS